MRVNRSPLKEVSFRCVCSTVVHEPADKQRTKPDSQPLRHSLKHNYGLLQTKLHQLLKLLSTTFNACLSWGITTPGRWSAKVARWYNVSPKSVGAAALSTGYQRFRPVSSLEKPFEEKIFQRINSKLNYSLLRILFGDIPPSVMSICTVTRFTKGNKKAIVENRGSGVFRIKTTRRRSWFCFQGGEH